MRRERTICRKQMCNDLMQVYREVVNNCPMGTTQTEVYEQVVRHPAPRFYIDAPRMGQIWREKTIETRRQKYKRIDKPYEKGIG